MAPRKKAKKEAPKKAATEKTAPKKVRKETPKKWTPEIKVMHLPAGREYNEPDRIVIHAMMERIDGLHAVDFLKSIGFSVHAMITPDGKIIRCREGNTGAYHAKYHNTNSLGVEFLVAGEGNMSVLLSAMQKDFLSGKQYDAGVHLMKYWLHRYNIKEISTHRYLSPGRKFDPGNGFPIKRLSKDIGEKINDIG